MEVCAKHHDRKMIIGDGAGRDRSIVGADFTMVEHFVSIFFHHHFYFPTQLIGGTTLSDLREKPWSWVSSLPLGTCLHFYRA